MTQQDDEFGQAGAERQDNSRQKAAEMMEKDRREKRSLVTAGVFAGAVIGLGAAVGIYAAVTSGQSAEDATASAGAPAGTVGPAYLAGSVDAPVVLDIYEDFQCPVCSTYEQALGPALEGLVADGSVAVKYHIMSFLGPGSEKSANAAGCAADGGKFAEFHQVLFENQPEKGSEGYTDESLIGYGQTVGLGGDFAECVVSGTHMGFADATDRAALENSIVGTPTFVVNGEKLGSANGAPPAPVDVYNAVVAATGGGGAGAGE